MKTFNNAYTIQNHRFDSSQSKIKIITSDGDAAKIYFFSTESNEPKIVAGSLKKYFNYGSSNLL